MEELKFVWLHGVDESEEIAEKVMAYLKERKGNEKVNYDENDTPPYIVTVEGIYVKEFIKEINKITSTIEPSVENVKDFFMTYFEQCGIELESTFDKRYNIEVTTEQIIYMLIDEKDNYFNEEIQNKILTGDFKKELEALAEKMYKDQLAFILNDLQASLSLAKYGK